MFCDFIDGLRTYSLFFFFKWEFGHFFFLSNFPRGSCSELSKAPGAWPPPGLSPRL